MKKRIVNISQIIIVLFILSLIYEFDKLKANQSKKELSSIRLLKSYSEFLDSNFGENENYFNPDELDPFIVEWNQENNKELFEYNLNARKQIERYLKSLGVTNQTIRASKTFTDPEGSSFSTSEIISEKIKPETLEDFENSVQDYLVNYHIFKQSIDISVITSIDTTALYSLKWKDEFPDSNDESLERQSQFFFKRCYLKNQSLFIELTEINEQQSQSGIPATIREISVKTEQIPKTYYSNIIPEISKLRALTKNEIKFIQKYKDESMLTTEGFLSREYMALFDKVDLFGFKLSNQSFSFVILIVLLFISIALNISTKQLVGKSFNLTESENIFAVFLNIRWLRQIVWILFPASICVISLINSFELNFYWILLCLNTLVIMYLVILSSIHIKK